jgi:ADP-heptose:LPS heptosyltransferase
MRILTLVPGGISDQILLFPTLDALRQAYPEAQIDAVIEPRAQSAYRLSKSVNSTVLFDFPGSNSLADFGNLLGVMRDREYDIALYLGKNWTISFLLWLTGIPTRIGFADGSGSLFLTQAIPRKPDQYAATMYHDLLQGLQVSVPCPELALNVPTADLAWADAERQRLGLAGGGYVLIDPGSTQDLKSAAIGQIYPVASWQAIIRDFQTKQPELPLAVVKASGNQATVAELLQVFPKLNVTAPANLGQLASMIAGASLMLCPESDSMHLSVAVQTFTLALFGATDPVKALPKNDRVLGIKSPTDKIADITPETVLKRVWNG